MGKRRKKSNRPFGKCIYCGLVKEMSDEHYLPECLGKFKNFEMLDDRICRECNSRCGEIEEQFCRGGEIGFFRVAFGIGGKPKKIKPNLFTRGSAGMPPYKMTFKLADSEQELLCQLIPGSKTDMEPLPQVVITASDGGKHHFIVSSDMADPEAFKAQVVNRGIEVTKIKSIYIFVPETEADRKHVEHLLSLIPRKSEVGWQSYPPRDPVRVEAVAKYGVDDKFFRAIAKIAFHYLIKQTHYRGDEPIFKGIRDFIINGGDFRKYVGCKRGEQILREIELGLLPSRTMHLITGEITASYIFSRLQFFVGPETDAPHLYKVLLGSPEVPLAARFGHKFVYYDQPIDRCVGIMLPLDPMVQSAPIFLPG